VGFYWVLKSLDHGKAKGFLGNYIEIVESGRSLTLQLDNRLAKGFGNLISFGSMSPVGSIPTPKPKQ
jgi:hypothetical protein